MAYSITTNDNVVISVTDELLNTDTSLTLIGRNAVSYGQSLATNSVRHLENFASNNPPAASVLPTGHLWYNKSENTLRVYNGSTWARTSLVPTSATALTTDLVAGTQYFDLTEDKLKVHDGAVFRDAVLPGGTVTSALSGSQSGSASNYGAKIETLFLTAQGGSPSHVPVLALKYVSDGSTPGEFADAAHDSAGATVMAIFSDTAFSIDANDPYYPSLSNVNSFSGTITKGMNLRADYTDSSIAQSDTSTFADQANALYVGGAPISSADYIHTGSVNWVPDTVGAVLGDASNRFDELHVNEIQVGQSGTPNVIGILGDVTLGNVSNEVKEIFVHDLHVSGDLDFAAVNTLTNLESADIDDVTLTTGTISTTASSATDIVNFSTLTAATTSTSLVAGATITAGPVTASQSHNVFLGAGSGNVSTVTHSGLTYVPSTSTLTAGTVAATTLTDGSFSVSSGSVTGVTDLDASGEINGDTLTDGTVTITNGAISGAQAITSFATVTGATLTDGTASINSGALTGATTGNFSGTVTAGLFSGTATQARYADLAEKYTADADYPAGTVVKIGGDAEITMTTEHADTEVFGVISTDPAYLMNKDIDGLPVALQGRVPVKVIGKVKKGQRLTSSDVPGLAWAADDETPLQAIIGRSLENKDNGNEGVVEAVIGVK
jgi:hypothetical protein